jgi:hypothetical protein
MKQRTQFRFSRSLAAAIIIVAVGLIGSYVVLSSHADTPTPSISSSSVSRSSCAHQHGPFETIGNHVVDGTGTTFTPYGITVFGLARLQWQASLTSDEAQIAAMAHYWCANTVRIQVSPDLLFTNPTSTASYNQAYLQALQQEVATASANDLNVVINAQTEFSVGGSLGPTAQTASFWQVIGSTFKADDNVIFDVFNAGSPTQVWSLWQEGGTYQGVSYIGMQNLITDIRQAGLSQLIWVEGPYFASTLNLAADYPLTGTNIVYDIHHPAGSHTPQAWDADFGDLAATKPVVVGEWAQYASPYSECWSDAVMTVPTFLSYLNSHSIGLIAWSLRPGILLQNASFTTPTELPKTYSCQAKQDTGAGQLLMNYFSAQNAGSQN